MNCHSYLMKRIMACISPNSRMVRYIDPIYGPLDEPLYMGSHIHQHPQRLAVAGARQGTAAATDPEPAAAAESRAEVPAAGRGPCGLDPELPAPAAEQIRGGKEEGERGGGAGGRPWLPAAAGRWGGRREEGSLTLG